MSRGWSRWIGRMTRAYNFEATDRLNVVVLYSNRSFSPKLLEGLEVLRVAEKITFPLERGKGGEDLFVLFLRVPGWETIFEFAMH